MGYCPHYVVLRCLFPYPKSRNAHAVSFTIDLYKVFWKEKKEKGSCRAAHNDKLLFCVQNPGNCGS